MNEHIRQGNQALARNDLEAAVAHFLAAADDRDPLVQRIARNRLYELHPEQVYASTHSYQRLFHRPCCSAKHVTQRRHIVWFRSASDAAAAGFVPCHNCRPPISRATISVHALAGGVV